ncbi:transcriptional regulator [Cereibacter ovatus]|uniref:Transcriptional regulator n=1 Tax=Cereibacter ovatus TaxID=439529 RepID=A0A285D4W5_9RHOB|nr:helix-turn-helix domain-containing protein [Cereibacter ovatus]SNX74857.1 transcriptional regulator [Cereibacter ovatus]
MDLRAHVMAHPADERLEVALQLLGELTGSQTVAALRHKFGLTPTQARMLAALNAAAPRVLDHQALFAAIYGTEWDRSQRSVHAVIQKMRAKLPQGLLVSHWGVGYSLARRIDVG